MGGDPEEIVIRPGFAIPFAELQFSFTTSSGPGGQKVNKTATKVRLKWWPLKSETVRKRLSPEDQARLLKRAQKSVAEDGSVQVVSDRYRTRASNRIECCRKLAHRIRAWLRKPKKRIPTRPTRSSKEKRLKEKKKTSRIKKLRKGPLED
jgi:ribosome-associated protein